MNYVFRPIDKWPRKMTPPHARKPSPFKVSGKHVPDGVDQFGRTKTRYVNAKRTPLSQTYEDLDRELYHLGVRGDVVIQVALKDRDIRQDGKPRADSRRPEHPGVILVFTARVAGKETPLSFACDDCEQWEDNLRAIVKTLEHLRGADRYGVTKSGEQYRGWNALPPAGPLVTPPPMTVDEAAAFMAKGVPGVNSTTILADAAVFRRLFRESALKLHPDANGGIERPEWHTLQTAKNVLDKHHGI